MSRIEKIIHNNLGMLNYITSKSVETDFTTNEAWFAKQGDVWRAQQMYLSRLKKEGIIKSFKGDNTFELNLNPA